MISVAGIKHWGLVFGKLTKYLADKRLGPREP
jgi:hypothetical protein